MLIVYVVIERDERLVVATIQDARSAAAVTGM